LKVATSPAARQKRVAAIHDISGFGKCSLTVALPIISAAGMEVSVIPTAVLSTHTGGLTGYTYRDLTEDMLPFARHWLTLPIAFDAVYSGFLGSPEQIGIVREIIGMFRHDGCLVVVDPVMADDGAMYGVFDRSFAKGMAELARCADVLVPNVTEAMFLLGEDYVRGPYEERYVRDLMRSLASMGPKKVVVTDVSYEDGTLGAASYDAYDGGYGYACERRVEGSFHGTGDVFGSVLVSAMLRGLGLHEASKAAVEVTVESIIRTHEAGTDVRFGVNFEGSIPSLLRKLGVI